MQTRTIEAYIEEDLERNPQFRKELSSVRDGLVETYNSNFFEIYAPKREWFSRKEPSSVHGISHQTRVLVLAELIGRGLVAQEKAVDLKALRWAAITHDTQRIDDWIDGRHGERSSRWFLENFSHLHDVDVRTVAYLNKWHVPDDCIAPKMTTELAAFKDADGLDRWRIGDLNTRYLRTDQGKNLATLSQHLLIYSSALNRQFGLGEFESVVRSVKLLTDVGFSQDSVPCIDKVPYDIGTDLSPREVFEVLERLAKERRTSDPELYCVLSKDTPYVGGIEPAQVLARYSLQEVSSGYRILLKENAADIDARFIHDGHVYTFRGDYKGLEHKGIFSFAYHRWNINLDQMLELLKDEPLSHHFNCRVRNKLEELMWIQSNGGYENFVSTTTSFRIARKHPKYQDNSDTVYVLRVPVERAFKNYASVCTDHEQEVLIPDYVLPDSIIAVVDPKKAGNLDVRDFMPH